jgi:AcrR family transcriptional regulator
MPRAFTETEKERIRARLIESGRECFARYGLAKTSIEDLVRPVGIAKATFYLFFESKEALYVETVKAETPQMMERLLDASFRKTDATRDAVVFLLKAIVHEIETNPLTNVLLGYPMDFERLTASLDVTSLLRDAKVMFDPILEEFRKAQKEGRIIPGDPYELLAATGVIKVYPMYKRRLPEPWYSRMLDRTAQLIADGLTSPVYVGEVGRPTARTSRRKAPAVRKENPALETDSPPGSATTKRRAAAKVAQPPAPRKAAQPTAQPTVGRAAPRGKRPRKVRVR